MIKAKLTKVPQTMLLPLIARAEISKKKNPILMDTKAIELSDSIDYDKLNFKRNIQEIGILGLAIRAKKFDDAIRTFLESHPNGKVLSIGAGLDTTFYRVDNGKVIWFDLDLPESMELRQKLLPPPSRVTYITKSMLDYTWIAALGDISGGLFIQIAGVLPYFKEEDVKKFLVTISEKLPKAEIIFDACSPFVKIVISQRIRQSGIQNAPIQWGITDISKLEKWSKHITIVKAEPIFKGIKRRFSYKWITQILMNGGDFFKSAQVVHLKFR